MADKLITPTEAAQLKGVSRAAIYAAIAEERLPAQRVLGRLALREVDVRAWTPARYAGRTPGIPMSEDAKARISRSQKQRWAQRKKQNQSRKTYKT